MMKTIFTLIVALLTTLSAAAQKLDGSWTGKLNVGQATLNIVFNIAKTKTTSCRARWTVPTRT